MNDNVPLCALLSRYVVSALAVFVIAWWMKICPFSAFLSPSLLKRFPTPLAEMQSVTGAIVVLE